MIMWAAPVGAFGAIAAVVGETGWAALAALGQIMLAFYITCALFILVVLGLLLRTVTGLSIFALLKYLAREYLLIVSTSSSETALPRLVAKMEHLGISRPVVGITVPTGYSFNLDGTAIYLTMASLFIAEAMGTPLSISEQISLLLFMIIASKGAAGVTGAGLATLAGGLTAHRPDLVDGVGLIVGIDRFMSEARAVTNFSGNAVATVLIGKWVGEFDKDKADRVLAGDDPFDESDMLDDDDEEAPEPGRERRRPPRHRSDRSPRWTRAPARPNPAGPNDAGARFCRRISRPRLPTARLCPRVIPERYRDGARQRTPSRQRAATRTLGQPAVRPSRRRRPVMSNDTDPVETSEWREAFDSVLEFDGADRAGLPARGADRRGPAQRRAGARTRRTPRT